MRSFTSIVASTLVAGGLIFGLELLASEGVLQPAQSAERAAADAGYPRFPVMDDYPPGKLIYLRRFLEDEARKTEDKSVILPPLMWKQNSVLTVAFNGGTEKLRSTIEATAKEWTRNSKSIQLQFRGRDGAFLQWSPSDTASSAIIRIGFDDQGYWSLVGRSNLYVEPSKKTMSLEGFDRLSDSELAADSWGKSYERTAVLHEFGHVFGFVHEQFHKVCQRDLLPNPDPGYVITYDPATGAVAPSGGKRPGYLLYFAGPPNRWTEPNISFNLNRDFYLSATGAHPSWPSGVGAPYGIDSAQPDRDSIMMYHLPDFIWANGAGSPCYTETWSKKLTGVDRATFDHYYP